MLSMLTENTNHIPFVPVGVFQKGILDAVEKKTGEKLFLEVFDTLDMSVFGRLIKIDKVRVTIVPRFSHKVFCFKKTYNEAVVNGLLMKKNYLN